MRDAPWGYITGLRKMHARVGPLAITTSYLLQLKNIEDCAYDRSVDGSIGADSSVAGTVVTRRVSVILLRIVDALRQYAWFDKRSGFLIAPTDRQLRAMTPDTVRRDVGQLLRLQHDTLYYGPRTISEATKVVSLGSRDKPARPRRERKYRSVDGPTIFFVDRGLAKATVFVLFPTSPWSHHENRCRRYNEQM